MKRYLYGLLIMLCLLFLLGVNETSENYCDKVIFEGYNLDKASSLEEIENEINNKNQSTVNVQIQFDYQIPSNMDKYNVSDDQIDNFIEESRRTSKEMHVKKNMELLSSLGIYGYNNIYISKYAPFVDFEFLSNDFIDVFEDIVERVKDKDYISHLFIQSEKNNYGQSFTTAKTTGNVTSAVSQYSLTGSGVKVGVLDPEGIINEEHANISGSNYTIRDEWFFSETVSDHATKVASVIAGNNGIAPNAHILSVELSGSASSEVDWLLDNGVNIINLSYGDANPDGQYNSKSAYMDYISRNHNVTIVASSGNYTTEDGYVTNPGLGYNVVTVGEANITGTTLSSSSAFLEVDCADKPTLVAPSGFSFPNYSSILTGTSFSAAYVSGCIALMMQKNVNLKVFPEKVIAILTASAVTMDNYTNKKSCGLNPMVGAGLIDLASAIETYNTTDALSNDVSNLSVVIYSKDVELSEGDTIKACVAWLINSDNTTTVNTTDYDIRLYQPEGYIISSATSTYNNIELVEYCAATGGTYRIEVRRISNHGDGQKDFYAVSYHIS